MSLRTQAQSGDAFALHTLRERALETGDHALHVEVARWRAAAHAELRFHEKATLTLVEIPAGRCRLRAQKLTIDLPTFHMAEHPVTNRQFATFLEDSGHQPGPGLGDFLAHWDAGAPPQDLLDHPVLHISLLDALAYCRWAGLWLPSEWMWEKAAAGPNGALRPWGASPPTRELAHYKSTTTCHVEAHREVRTIYGCQGMLGNVSEWCLGTQDHEDILDPGDLDVRDPDAWLHVQTPVRGSCYLRRGLDLMTNQHRRFLSAGRRNRWVGFRPVALS